MLKSPERPSLFPEASTAVVMEHLHPDDQAELAATAEMMQRADDMEAAYKAAAACLSRV